MVLCRLLQDQSQLISDESDSSVNAEVEGPTERTLPLGTRVRSQAQTCTHTLTQVEYVVAQLSTDQNILRAMYADMPLDEMYNLRLKRSLSTKTTIT